MQLFSTLFGYAGRFYHTRKFFAGIILLLTPVVSMAQCPGTVNLELASSPCKGNSLTFNNTSTGTADFYTWKWGDGTPDDGSIIGISSRPHIFANAGTFTVELVKTCGGNTDKKSISVTIVDFPAKPIINSSIANPCGQQDVNFTIPGALPGVTYTWNFGDAASGSRNTAIGSSVTHAFSPTGFAQSYNVTAVADLEGCKSNLATMSVSTKATPKVILTDNSIFDASYKGAFFRCESATSPNSSYTFVFKNESITENISTEYIFKWKDGSPDTVVKNKNDVSHTYKFNVYSLEVSAFNPATGCASVGVQEIANLKKPNSNWDRPDNQVEICEGVDLLAENLSSNATTYLWIWGDGDSTLTTQTGLTKHSFNISRDLVCNKKDDDGVFKVESGLYALNKCDLEKYTKKNTDILLKPNPLVSASQNIICKTNVDSEHEITFTADLCPGPKNPQTININFGDSLNSGVTNPNIVTLSTNFNTPAPVTFKHKYKQPGRYIIKLTSTNSCGSRDAFDTIYVQEPAIASFTEGLGTKNSGSCTSLNADFSPVTNCGPFTIAIKNTSTNLAPDDFLLWEVSAGATFGSSNSINSGSLNDSVKFNNPGQYKVTLSVKNTCNGSVASTSCAIVNVKGIPQITGSPGTTIGGFSGVGANPNFVPVTTGADAGKFVACGTQNVTQLSVKNPDATVTGYKWTITPTVTIPNDTLQNPGAVSFPPGDYVIKANVKNICGNIDLNPVEIKITTPPVANAGGTPPPGGVSACPGGSGISGVGTMKEVVVCSGVDVLLGAGAAVGGVTYQWTATGTNPLPAAPTQPTTNVNITNTGAANTCHKYYLEAKDVCNKKDSILVVVKPAPAVNIGATGATGTNADTSVCISSGDFNLFALPGGGTWTSTTAGAVAGTQFKTAAAGTGLHTLQYKYQDPGPGGCEITKTKKLRVNGLPTVSINPDNSYCESALPFNLSGSPAGGTWSGSVAGAINGAGSFTTSVVGAGNSVELTYSFTDANTCTDVAKKTVNIVAPVKPNPGAAVDSLCKNAPALQLVGFTPAGGTWSGSVVDPGGLFNPGTLAPGDYVLTYTINAGTPCVRDTTKKIVVKPIPTVTPGSYGPYCEDAAPVKLSAVPGGGTWTGPVGAITRVGSDTLFDPKIAGKSSGHTLSYTFTNAFNCSVTEQTSIEVKELPDVNAGLDITVCINPAAYDLTGFNTVTGGTSTWKKLSTGTTNTISNAAKFAPNQIGIDTLEYTISFSGCSSSDTVVVTVVEPKQADAGTDTSLCVDAGIFTLVPGAATPFVPADGSRWEGPGVVSGTSTFDPASLTPGQLNAFQKYYYFYGGGNCITKDSVLVKTYSLPAITPPATPAGTLCEDVSPMIISGYTAETPGQSAFDSTFGVWTGPGVTKIAGSENYLFDPNVAGPSATPYELEYTYTDAGTKNCQSVFKLPITVAPLPVADFTLPAVYCVNVELTAINNSTVSIGSLDKNNWNWGNGAPGAVQTGIPNADGKFTYTAQGDFTVSFTVISAAGCDSSVTKNIKIITPPKAEFEFSNSTPDSGCGPLEVKILDKSTGFDSVYTWNFGNSTVSSSYISNDTSITYLQGRITDTLYYISLTVSNLCATDVYEDSVRVYPKPFVVFGTDKNEGCSAAPINFTNNSLGIIKGQPTSYIWKFGDGKPNVGPLLPVIKNGERFEPEPGTHWFSYEGFNDTTYTITLVAENLCGIDSTTRTVKVFPNNVKAFFNQHVNEGCSPLTVNFTDFSTGGTYVAYDFGDGNSEVVKDVTHTFENLDSDIKIFKISQFVNNGCSYDSAYQDIKVFPQPKVSFTVNKDVLCRKENITLINTSEGISGSRWNLGNGTPEITNITTNIRLPYDTVGTFTVSLIGKESLHQCTDTAFKTVTIKAPPVPGFLLSDTAGCQPFAIKFTSAASPDAESFSWKFGDGNTAGVRDPVNTFDNHGVFYATQIVENADGCIDSLKQRIRIFEKPSVSFSEVSSLPSPPCEFPITAGFNSGTTSANVIDYTWEINNVFHSSAKDPVLDFETAGEYTVKLTGKTKDECYDSAVYVKTVNPLPIAKFTVGSYTGCYPYYATFDNESESAANFFWDFGDNTQSIANTDQVVHVYDEGMYSVSLTAISADGCRDTDSLPTKITVIPRPEADFSYELEQDPTLYGTVYFKNLSRESINYLWNYGDGTTTDTDSTDLLHRYELFGNKNVTLIATNVFNCKDTLEQTVNVPFFGGLFLPNAFTPDYGEDAVREFKPVGKGLEQYNLRIYDTWGILIWESDKIDADTGPAEGWDGTKNGTPLPQDVYVWKCEAKFIGGIPWQGMDTGKGKLRKTGTITLIR